MPEPVTYEQPDGTRQIEYPDGLTILFCEHYAPPFGEGVHPLREGVCKGRTRALTPCDSCCTEYSPVPERLEQGR